MPQRAFAVAAFRAVELLVRGVGLGGVGVRDAACGALDATGDESASRTNSVRRRGFG